MRHGSLLNRGFFIDRTEVLTPTIVIPAYIPVGFLVASILMRFGFFNNANNTPDAIFGFIMTMLFWPLGVVYGVLYLPARAFYEYVEYLHKLGANR